jgi:hypothetical protein
MFRITTHSANGELVMKLEGCLEGPVVPELEACWRQVGDPSGGRRVRLDLVEVCHVDAAGRELLGRMCRAGIAFTARGCVMPELMKEIAQGVRN